MFYPLISANLTSKAPMKKKVFETQGLGMAYELERNMIDYIAERNFHKKTFIMLLFFFQQTIKSKVNDTLPQKKKMNKKKIRTSEDYSYTYTDNLISCFSLAMLFFKPSQKFLCCFMYTIVYSACIHKG